MSEAPPASAPRQVAVPFILITVLLDMLSFGIIIGVLPKLVEEFLGADTAHVAVLHTLRILAGLSGVQGLSKDLLKVV